MFVIAKKNPNKLFGFLCPNSLIATKIYFGRGEGK